MNSGGFCVLGDINDTSISWGDKFIFTTNNAYYQDTVRLNDSSFAIAYQDWTTNNTIVVIANIQGSDIVYGSDQIIVSNESNQNIAISKFDETRVLVSYRNSSDKPTAVIGDIIGTSITWGSINSTDFTLSTSAYNVNSSVINSSKFVLAYSKGNENGYVSVGSLTTLKSTGIAATGGTSGGTIKVAFSGLVDGLSGLSANTQYYADDNGNLTTTETERYIGTALSTTSLLIQSALPGAQAIEDGDIVASKLSGSSGTGLENGTSGQVLQSNADGTFSWADMIRLTPQSSAPATCDSTLDGMMALTSDYKLCVCRPDEWRKIDADTACLDKRLIHHKKNFSNIVSS